jgi:RimJ/RimL family protein N-acetyltransferase
MSRATRRSSRIDAAEVLTGRSFESESKSFTVLVVVGPHDRVRIVGFDSRFAGTVASWITTPDQLFSWAGARFQYPLEQQDLRDHAAAASAPDSTTSIFSAVIQDRVVGHAELTTIDPVHGTTVMRRVIVDPAVRRRGIGRTIVEHLLEVAFRDLRLHRVELRAFDTNLAAIALYRALGFTVEGRLREYRRHDGLWRSALVMGMLASEWPAADQSSSRRFQASSGLASQAITR